MSELPDERADLERPVFLVGPMRAGTTLLRLMLHHHPDVCFFGEFEYPFTRLRGDAWPTREEFLRDIATHRVFEAAGHTVPEGLDPAGLTRHFLAERVRGSGARLVGATVHSRFDRIPDVWPAARYVHITRDPRDVARSCIGMGWVGHVHHGALFWLRPEQRWDVLRGRTDAADRTEVRYEDLIREPEATLSGICAFLGIEYTDRMFDYEDGTDYGRPDASLVEQWRRKLSDREIELVEHVCGDLMRDRGYEPVHSPPRAPGAVERAALWWRSRAGRSRFLIRRYGFPLWMTRNVVRRLPVRSWKDAVQRRVNAVDRRHLR